MVVRAPPGTPAPARGRPGRLRQPYLRHQLPVHSPLSLGALARGARAAAGLAGDAAAVLQRHLLDEFSADGVLLTESGTAALTLAIRSALDTTAAGGDARIVALPGFCCFDVATATIGAEARVILYDLDPATLGPDPQSLESALQRGASVVVAAPLYGIPIDWAAVETLAQGYGAFLIEDAAQGHGASYCGRPLGSLARLSVLSFGRGKGWTGGGGGALMWRGFDPFLPDPVDPAGSSVRALVSAAAHWFLGRPELYALPAAIPWLHLGETRYRPPTETLRASVASAALALATRDAAKREATIRRRNAAALVDLLGDIVTHPSIPDDAAAGYLRLPVRVPGHAASIIAAVLAGRGVAATYPFTLASLPALESRLAGPTAPLSGAEAMVRELITLPVHGLLGDGEIDRLATDVRMLIRG